MNNRGRNCVVCGVFFKDTIPGYPNPEAICDDCYSDRESVRRQDTLARLDKEDLCGNCGGGPFQSLAEHQLHCRYEISSDAAMKILEGKGAAQPKGR